MILLFKLALLFIQMRITIVTTIATTIATPTVTRTATRIATRTVTTTVRMLEVCGRNGQHMVSIVLPRPYHTLKCHILTKIQSTI